MRELNQESKVKRSLKTKMILAILVPVIIIIILVIGINYIMLSRSAYSSAENKSESLSLQYAADVQAIMNDYIYDVNEAGVHLEYVLNSESNDYKLLIEEETREIISLNDDIESIWMVWTGGDISSNEYIYSANKTGKASEGIVSGIDSEILEETRQILQMGEDLIIEPYLREDTMFFVFAIPLVDEISGDVSGFLGVEFNLNSLQGMIEGVTIFEESFMRILANNGVVVAHPNFARVGTYSGELDENGQGVYLDYIKSGELNTSLTYSKSVGKNMYKSIAPIEVNDEYWAVGTVIYQEEIMAEANKNLMIVLIIGLVFLVIIAAIIIIISNMIASPIMKLTKAANLVATHNLSENISDNLKASSSEVGKISRAFDRIIKNLKEFVISNKDNSSKLFNYSEQLAEFSNESLSTSEQIINTTEEIARAATHQAEDTETVAEGMTSLSNMMINEEKEIQNLNDSADKVIQLKDEGVSIIEDLVKKTKDNQRASQEIGEVIVTTNESAERIYGASQMIKNIADQTNLLALNAAIEAARAGEAGRGFSIVADEIRKLAEESDKFSEEINAIVFELREKTERAVSTIQEVDTIVKSQSESVDKTQDKFEGISDSIEKTKEIIEIINKSNKRMVETKEAMSIRIEGLAATTEEHAAGTQEVNAAILEQNEGISKILEESKVLKDLAKKMVDDVSTFKLE